MGITDKFYFEWQNQIVSQLNSENIFDNKTFRSILCIGDVQEPNFIKMLRNNKFEICNVTCLDVGPFLNQTRGIEFKLGNINDLSKLSDNSFDLVTIFRTSMFIENKENFLQNISRVLKKNGYLVADWLHGHSDYPHLGFNANGPIYAGIERKFKTTYIDNEIIKENNNLFKELIKHINKPPGINLLGKFLNFFRGPIDNLTLDSYEKRLKQEHNKNNYDIIDISDLKKYNIKKIFSCAKYFYKNSNKCTLFLFIVLKN